MCKQLLMTCNRRALETNHLNQVKVGQMKIQRPKWRSTGFDYSVYFKSIVSIVNSQRKRFCSRSAPPKLDNSREVSRSIHELNDDKENDEDVEEDDER